MRNLHQHSAPTPESDDPGELELGPTDVGNPAVPVGQLVEGEEGDLGLGQLLEQEEDLFSSSETEESDSDSESVDSSIRGDICSKYTSIGIKRKIRRIFR